ncbi:MAG: hypothetical protein P4L57_11745 [Rhizomicrobium sp.]|nr:hypothetical protein [Rhizomicrobium sp.]
MRIWKVVVAIAAITSVAGCGSPESKIKASCVKGGGLGNLSLLGQKVDDQVIDKQCSCYAGKLKGSLSDDQLNAVAKLSEMPKEQQEVAARNTLTGATYGAVFAAAKSCAAP